jgi:putative transposase
MILKNAVLKVIAADEADLGPSWRVPQRVVAIDRSEDALLLMPAYKSVEDRQENKEHWSAPKAYCLSGLEALLKEGRIATTFFNGPPEWSMTDEDYLALGGDEKSNTRKRQLAIRDRTKEVIDYTLGERDIEGFCLLSPEVKSKVVEKAAKRFNKGKSTIYSNLHRYMASGGVTNSLIPDFKSRGGKGKTRKQNKKLGRIPQRVKDGRSDELGYLLTDEDKGRLKTGYALCAFGKVSLDQAYLRTMLLFWSQTDEKGEVSLLPNEKRPTKRQFGTWGKQGMGMPMGGLFRTAFKGAVRSEKAQNVGQVAEIDATKTDLYLRSLYSPTRVLPPMSRTTIVEQRSTAILGFYIGHEHASSWTALEAFLCAAMDKSELCARFDIEIAPGDWPGMIPQRLVGDGGEVKSKNGFDSLHAMGVHTTITMSYTPEIKGTVEGQHSADQAKSDHLLEGSTKGRARERGEEHASQNARFNYFEYMQFYLANAIAHNNEEVPDRAPTMMKVEGVRPTRINILKWMREHNMTSEVYQPEAKVRAICLRPREATMTEKGIFIIDPLTGKQVVGVRYFSEVLHESKEYKRSLKKRVREKVFIRMDDTDLSRVWIQMESGLHVIPCVESDDDLRRLSTIADQAAYDEMERPHREANEEAAAQARAKAELKRLAVGAVAKARLDEAMAFSGQKAGSKKVAAEELRQNLKEEKEMMNQDATYSWRGSYSAAPEDPVREEVALPAEEDIYDIASMVAMGSLESVKQEEE